MRGRATMSLTATLLMAAPVGAALAAQNQTRQLLGCQSALAREALHVVARHERAVLHCARSLLRCQLATEMGTRVPGGAKCADRAVASCQRGARKLAAARNKTTKALRSACRGLEPAALHAPTAGLGLGLSGPACNAQSATQGALAEFVACMIRGLEQKAEQAAAVAFPRACGLFRAAALDLYPALPCPASDTGGSCAGLGGTWSGVTFSDQEAHDVLDLVNKASAERLDAIRGIGPSLAAAMVAARPFAAVGDVDAVPGIGPTLLETLRTEASGSWCTEAEASCGCQ